MHNQFTTVSSLTTWLHTCLPSLRCSSLPLVAGGVEWSPGTHLAFPPAFQAAVRALLLVNEHGALGEGEPLPAAALHNVLRLAARPLPVWVPELSTVCLALLEEAGGAEEDDSKGMTDF